MAGSFRHGSDQWPVLGLRSLLEDPAFTAACGMNADDWSIRRCCVA